MFDPSSQSDPYGGIAAGFVVGLLLFYAVLIAFAVYCYVRVARKAGYSGWYAALCFVPLVNLVVILLFVFKEWPIEAELRMLRSGHAGYGGYPGQHPTFAAPAAGYPTPYPYPDAPPYGGPTRPGPGQTWGQAPEQTGGYPPADPGPQAPPWGGPPQA